MKKFTPTLIAQPDVAQKELLKEGVVAHREKTCMVVDVMGHAKLGVDNLVEIVADVINPDTGVIQNHKA